MIKSLQKRFIVTAMSVVTVLLILLLGVINCLNIVLVRREVDKTLNMISQAEGNPDYVNFAQNSMPPHRQQSERKDDQDKFFSSNFFTVRIDGDGKTIGVDVSRTSAIDEQAATEYALDAIAQNKPAGKLGNFRYQIRQTRIGDERILVFLDTSEEVLSYLRVLLLSCGAGLLCWLLMLLLTAFLSGKAIRPIAENIEKQNQFVTNAGHEIKTPLAIIQSNTDAMELYLGENKWSRNVRQQVTRLNGLMKNLLTLARFDEKVRPVSFAEFSLDRLLSDSLESFSAPIAQKGIVLQKEISPEIRLNADQDQVLELLTILLDNAVKYTEENGSIFVSLHSQDGKPFLNVKNTCATLPDCPPEKLFDRFYRADTARTQKSGGYGLGLSIAAAIVQANGGKISCKFENQSSIIFAVTF